MADRVTDRDDLLSRIWDAISRQVENDGGLNRASIMDAVEKELDFKRASRSTVVDIVMEAAIKVTRRVKGTFVYAVEHDANTDSTVILFGHTERLTSTPIRVTGREIKEAETVDELADDIEVAVEHMIETGHWPQSPQWPPLANAMVGLLKPEKNP